MNKFISILSCLLVLIASAHPASAEDKRPDVVFIIVDDLNDWLDCFATCGLLGP